MKFENLIKNPELRKELIIYILTTLVLFGLGFWISSGCALMLLAAGLLFSGLHIWFLNRRYVKLAELSSSIDRVLHQNEKLNISESEEGELAILKSEIRKMAVRLQESADSAKQDKLELSQALADISHQLRTPLTAMNLTLSLLTKEHVGEQRRTELLRELKRELSRIDWLVETLLKLSKLDAGTVSLVKERVPVGALIRRATQSLEIPMELRGQQLVLDYGDEWFEGDLAWSAEALGNLVKNCMEHTPEGGTVTVKAGQTAIFTEITVRDTGAGFDAEDLPHLFERFYRGKNAGAGSIGIGLALARSVAAAQNGTLRARNHPDGGAEFELRFYHTVV